MDDNDILIFDVPGGCYDEGMIALKGIRVFPAQWQARTIGIAVNGRVVMMSRQEALDVALELKRMAHDG